MVGVREPVRVRPGRRDDRPLLEHEHDVSRPGRTRRPDRLGPFRVRDRVAARSRSSASAAPRASRGSRAPSTSAVRISRCGSRGPLSEPAPRSAPRRYARRQQRRATTRPGGWSTGLCAESRTPGLVERLVRVRRAFDVELIARRPFERGTLIRADLRLDFDCAQQRERAARDRGAGEVEVERDLATAAEMDAARDVKQAGQLGEAVAVRLGRDRRELCAEVLRQRSTLRAPAAASCTRGRASRTSRARPPTRRGGTDEEAEPVAGAEAPGRAGRARRTGERRELAVRHHLAARDRMQRLERSARGTGCRTRGRRATSSSATCSPAKYACSRSHQRDSPPWHGGRRLGSSCQTTTPSSSDELPHAPSFGLVRQVLRRHAPNPRIDP